MKIQSSVVAGGEGRYHASLVYSKVDGQSHTLFSREDLGLSPDEASSEER